MHPRSVAVAQIVQQRVLVERPFEVALAIEPCIEARRGVAGLLVALHHVVLDRVHPRRRDVGIVFQVPGRIELRDRAHMAAVAAVEEMPQA
jgi:hypothetical protein